MANLGAEVSRLFSAKENGNERQIRECLERAQKILKEIMTIPDMKTRIVEMNALSSIINDITSNNPKLQISRKNISAYFTPFALRIMNQKKLEF